MQKDKLIHPDRVKTNSYYLTWRQEFRLAGFIQVTPYTAPPPYDTWSNRPYNKFCTIAHEAIVDTSVSFVLPCFFNDRFINGLQFDGEDRHQNYNKPAVTFFKGNDDWHYALRYSTFHERDDMVAYFGEELGFLHSDLIGHN